MRFRRHPRDTYGKHHRQPDTAPSLILWGAMFPARLVVGAHRAQVSE